MLIKLDAFRGQKRKLKNRWSVRATYRGEPCGGRCTHVCCEVREDWKRSRCSTGPGYYSGKPNLTASL